jgi:hypothetical protein
MRVFGIFLLAGMAMAQAPSYHEVASIAQLMQGLVDPTSKAIAEAVKEAGPADDRAWKTVQSRAVMLQEAAQLLMVGKRVKDQEAWIKAAQAMNDVGANIAKAAEEKNLASLQAAAGTMTSSCRGCHTAYRFAGRGQKKQ